MRNDNIVPGCVSHNSVARAAVLPSERHTSSPHTHHSTLCKTTILAVTSPRIHAGEGARVEVETAVQVETAAAVGVWAEVKVGVGAEAGAEIVTRTVIALVMIARRGGLEGEARVLLAIVDPTETPPKTRLHTEPTVTEIGKEKGMAGNLTMVTTAAVIDINPRGAEMRY